VDAYRFAVTGAAATGALCQLTGMPLLAGVRVSA